MVVAGCRRVNNHVSSDVPQQSGARFTFQRNKTAMWSSGESGTFVTGTETWVNYPAKYELMAYRTKHSH